MMSVKMKNELSKIPSIDLLLNQQQAIKLAEE